MSPFSHLLRSLRKKRNLLQKDAAELLGYEQSYLSALEHGARGKPQQEFIDKLIKRYDLSDAEIKLLLVSLSCSERHYSVPLSASSNAYCFMYSLNHKLHSLTDEQISLMNMVLELKENVVELQ